MARDASSSPLATAQPSTARLSNGGLLEWSASSTGARPVDDERNLVRSAEVSGAAFGPVVRRRRGTEEACAFSSIVSELSVNRWSFRTVKNRRSWRCNASRTLRKAEPVMPAPSSSRSTRLDGKVLIILERHRPAGWQFCLRALQPINARDRNGRLLFDWTAVVHIWRVTSSKVQPRGSRVARQAERPSNGEELLRSGR